MNRITNYYNFLEDNQLQILLEANITFDDKFKGLLNQINSPIANLIKSLEGEEVDVNTNHISFNTDKENIVTFLPDTKTKNIKTYYDSGAGTAHWSTAQNLLYSGHSFFKDRKPKTPPNHTEIKVVKRAISIFEIHTTFGMMSEYFDDEYASGGTVSLISWEDEDNETYYMLCDTSCIKQDFSGIKRSDISVGRFARALLTKAGETVDNKELEDFVNKYKAAVLIEKESFTRFDIVKEEDIRKWYSQYNYADNNMGTLGNSCMRYDSCAKYLDIYVDNPKEVNLVILKSKTNEEKIIGRALLWYTDDGRKFMDRIYVNNYADVSLFIEYAIQSGFHYKKNQTYEEGEPLMFNGEQLTLRDSEIIVTLTNGGDYDYYPYIDTLKYYNPDDDTLSNDSSIDYKYELTDTDGGNGRCEECGGRGVVSCEDCTDGRYECYECEGSGNKTCEECDGVGETMCVRCDDGKVDCSNGCTNGSVDCGDCNGSGENEDGEECSTCSGSGELECTECNGSGTEECEECEGSSYVSCTDCDGDGKIDCNICDGDGDMSCDTCGGDGEVDCNECR